MNEEEKKAVEKFRKLGIKKFREEKLKSEDLLSYFEFVIILNLIEKLQKENEEIEEKDKIIQNMSKYILSLDIDKDICMKNTANTELCNEDNSNCVECIRKHFSN